jgi:hypothetical protein
MKNGYTYGGIKKVNYCLRITCLLSMCMQCVGNRADEPHGKVTDWITLSMTHTYITHVSYGSL